MIKTVKRILGTFGVMALFLCPISLAMASAEGTAVTTASGAASYTYIARTGDSLSKMVRHSLQLYAQANKLTLEPSRAMYCEAVVSQGLGSIRLEVGQRVEITMQDLQNCISQARQLTTDDLTGWQAYADQVSFDTGDLQPISTQTPENNSPAPSSSQESMTPATPAEPAEPTAPSEPSAANAPVQPAAPAPAPTKKTISKWWYAALGVLIIIYFLFADRMPRPHRS